MLESANLMVSGLLLALIVGQGIYVGLYLRMRSRKASGSGTFQPPASIILCLRGRDPTLTRCLRALGTQDYPDYEIITVFDSNQDPAFPVVEEFCKTVSVPIRLVVLPGFSGRCGMKCEALIEGVRQLRPESQVVAMIDADSIAAPNWLREMVAPLQDQQVGVVTGDRWFEPQSDLASISRAVWNAAAIVQMNLYRIVWGGSMAIRRPVLEQLGLVSIWKSTFCEDTVLVDLLKKHRLRVVRPRQAVVFNSESIAWRNLHFWIARQLLTVRLHNQKWPLVFAHGILVGATVILCLLLIGMDLYQREWRLAAMTTTVILSAEFLNFCLIGLISRENLSILKSNQQSPLRPSFSKWPWRWFLAIPVTQFVHFLSTLRAFRMEYVVWRGIEYRVRRDQIELVRYRPFLDRNNPEAEDKSLQ